jgi:hypothetical protein
VTKIDNKNDNDKFSAPNSTNGAPVKNQATGVTKRKVVY